MGAVLPKPVESTVIERRAAGPFRVGIAEMNGWRSSMEDAHLIHMQPDWGFFGVFDGHGGDKCAGYVAGRLGEELRRHGCPEDDAALKQLVLGVDKAFLATRQPSGSTGTMCIVHSSRGRGKFRLRVANCGDSRVLLGKRDGTIVDGGGTDQGLTTDHKPSHPGERQRIYRCGGHVEEAAGGVPRVNGELAVSRGFGDADFKKTGGPGPEDHPVTANPELGHFECDSSDFLLLVCDGVSEGDFSNAEVVKLVADTLRKKEDPGVAAEAVIKRAIETNSKDNISCMVVLMSGASGPEESVEFNPGPLTAPEDKTFMTAYEAMAKRAGLTLAQAAELRFERLQQWLSAPGGGQEEALHDELALFGSPAGTKGSEERKAWFRSWLQKLAEIGGGGRSEGAPLGREGRG
ncbi:unnamed protein product [Prorocentrum cordatum]|uniref:PPM-type phosphatase domain-containing protein n=1 Tax=Prorocentrum cordatum TaxID=2364126 RepID=A0ABN9PHA6_9DINO|nr:unnamed protein product [Polarella glacialis]